MSGLTRMEIATVRPLPAAIAARSSSSASDSILTQRMLWSTARAQQFAARDDIGAGAEFCQRSDYRLVGIRLQRIADQRVDIGEGAGEDFIVPLDGRARIAIERRADGVGQRVEIDRFGMEHAVAISKVMHDTCLAGE